jgi:hypothetical protein
MPALENIRIEAVGSVVAFATPAAAGATTKASAAATAAKVLRFIKFPILPAKETSAAIFGAIDQ